MTELVEDNNAGVQNDQVTSDAEGTSDARRKAMRKIHDTTLPGLLNPKGWRKVYDKDMKPTYRALYFNTIKKEYSENDNCEEDEISHIQRVNKIRKEVQEKAKEVMKEYKVEFNPFVKAITI